MPKLRDIKGFMRLTLDKLPGIKADLVRLDDELRERDFPKLVESLRKWTDRNPKTMHNSRNMGNTNKKMYFKGTSDEKP